MRLYAQTAIIEAGKVLILRRAAWRQDPKAELMRFPHGKHTDHVDSVSQFLNWAEKREAHCV